MINNLYPGILAQLGEHLPYKQRVIGSSPIGPTKECRALKSPTATGRSTCRQGPTASRFPLSAYADVAQLAEQLICNQQVIGSSPIIGFYPLYRVNFISGRVPEWPKGTDCKSAGNAFSGSNPLSPITVIRHPPASGSLLMTNTAGWSSLEARRAHNPKVTGSNPVPAILKSTI